MFKKIKIFFFISFFLYNPNRVNSEIVKIKLSNEAVVAFYNYISSDRGPLDKFLVTVDGQGVFIWACPQTLCFPAHTSFYTKPCSKLHNGKKCKIFAVNRKIRLDKSIKHVKFSENLLKFKKKNTLKEVKKNLKELGHIN